MPGKNGNKADTTLATAVTEVSERVTVLIREEIELAKAEVSVKVKSLTKGIVWFVIAAVLGFFGVIFIPVTIAWLLDDLLVDGAGGLWYGFAIVMGVFLVGAGVCVVMGIRKMKIGSPAPKMAIEEAKKIRETVATSKPEGNGSSPTAASEAAAAKARTDAAALAAKAQAEAVVAVPATAPAATAATAVLDPPAAETPAAETSAAATPAAETLAAATPAAETSAAETPAADTPTAETPAVVLPEAETAPSTTAADAQSDEKPADETGAGEPGH